MSTVTQQPGSYRHLDEQYLLKYGVKCAECGQLFVGKVLQAREKKYHPSCAKCSRCGGPFVEGDEMCIKGTQSIKSLQYTLSSEATATSRENIVLKLFIFQNSDLFHLKAYYLRLFLQNIVILDNGF